MRGDEELQSPDNHHHQKAFIKCPQSARPISRHGPYSLYNFGCNALLSCCPLCFACKETGAQRHCTVGSNCSQCDAPDLGFQPQLQELSCFIIASRCLIPMLFNALVHFMSETNSQCHHLIYFSHCPVAVLLVTNVARILHR